MATANSNFDQVLATTINAYRKTLADNVFKSNPLWMKMHENREIVDGGNKYVVPIMHGQNSTAGWLASEYATIDLSAQTGISAAEYDWKQHGTSIIISNKQLAQNQGEKRVVKLLEAKIKQAELSLAEDLEVALFGDGTSNDIAGLQAVTATTGTYGNINKATQTFWQGYAETTSTALTLSHMRTAVSTIVVSEGGSAAPDLIATSSALDVAYRALVAPHLRLQDNKLADAGFHNTTFQGIPVVVSPQCTSTDMFFVTTKFLHLGVLKGEDFNTSEFMRSSNQLAKSALLSWTGALGASNCAKQGRLSNKT